MLDRKVLQKALAVFEVGYDGVRSYQAPEIANVYETIIADREEIRKAELVSLGNAFMAEDLPANRNEHVEGERFVFREA